MKECTILVRREDGAFVVDVPAVRGCHTVGDTLAEAIQNAQEAIALYLETPRDRGDPIPEDRSHSQAIWLRVAA